MSDLNFGVNVNPVTDDSYSLGSNEKKWRTYISQINGVEVPSSPVFTVMSPASDLSSGGIGLVPAPAVGEQGMFLRGDGTWATPVTGTMPYEITLDQVTNTSGAYSHTTIVPRATSTMKAIMISASNPAAFLDPINIAIGDGSVTLTCDNVSGTSGVSIVAVDVDPITNAPEEITSAEFDILNDRIGSLSSLTTTAKTNVVAAINEAVSTSISLGETSSTAYQGDRGKIAYDHAQAKGNAYSSGLYKIVTNAQGHVVSATAVTKDDIIALGFNPIVYTTGAEPQNPTVGTIWLKKKN